MKVKKMWVIILICIISVIGISIGTKYLLDVKKYKNEVADIQIKDIDMTKIPDGKYTGECDVNFIDAKVVVEVKNKKIINITIVKHKNGRGKPAEKVVDEVKEKNSLQVDAVSGATNSSKVILKAIENALSNNKNYK